MKTVCYKNKCNGCMACIEKCPKKCINIEDNMETFNAIINENECVSCNLCKQICPNINKVEAHKPIMAHQGWGKNGIREIGSSGGVASTVIRSFISNGGYVASCIFSNNEFKFIITNNISEVIKFAGSKYVKSNPKGIYTKIEEVLKDNKVLFIGLPCQVAALKNIIKNKQNLYTIDLICHGTPSQKLLNKYLVEEGFDLKLIEDVKFRKKSDYGLIINNKKIKCKRVLDEYLCAFLESISFTENCYSCNYAKLERISDITLGDSWGTDLKDEEKKGVSVILIQTEKGKELVKKSKIVLKDIDLNNAIKYNHPLKNPAIVTNKRAKFFKAIKNGKKIKYATFVSIPKRMLKQYIKKMLIELKIIK